MPGGGCDPEGARTDLGTADAAVAESACRFAARTPASHDALWTAVADALTAAGGADCASTIKIRTATTAKPNEKTPSRGHGRFGLAFNVLDSFRDLLMARARTGSMQILNLHSSPDER
jgi:hypothetical protein